MDDGSIAITVVDNSEPENIGRSINAAVSSIVPPTTVEQSIESKQQLQQLYVDTTAQFRSCEQGAAIDVVLHTNCDLLAVLPTGCDRSLLFFLYIQKYHTLTSIVVVPTVSVMKDLTRRAENHNISCSDEPGSVTHQRLVFVTPEMASGNTFYLQLVHRLYGAKQLGKIFVDEAHLFSTEIGLRPAFRELAKLTFLKVPFVLMTATAPEWIVQDIFKSFFGYCRKPVVIRQTTSRLNVAYSVHNMATDVSCIANHCAQVLPSYGIEDRCIVYVSTIKSVEHVKEVLVRSGFTCTTYTGQQEDQTNANNYQQWREGKAIVMIATSAFGVGIDYVQVRTVLFFVLASHTPWRNLCSRLEGLDEMESPCLLC